MVRKRITERGCTDFDALLKAIRAVKIDKKSKKSVSKEYNIPKTSMLRYQIKLDAKFPDISTVDDAELLKVLRGIAGYSSHKQVISI